MNICGKIDVPCFTGEQYVITFIGDFSQYSYIYLIKEKSNALDVFKVFKVEVENQLERKIKVMISDKSGEYYGRWAIC